ncbi:MAG TPA: YfhO family protein [Armatimonadota bacterium]|nr:YfhO family protein [Armatimonadota bacterium]
MEASPPNRLRRWIPYAAFLVLAIAACPGVIVGRALVPAHYQQHWAPWGDPPVATAGEPIWNPLAADGVLQFYPWRHFARVTLRSGEVPLWNPYQFCGTPFAANGQSAVFYPPNLLFWLLPTASAFGWSAVVHLFMAGTFTYWLGRAVELSDAAASLAGVAFMLCGWLIAWLPLPTFMNVIVWLPLAMCAGKRHFDGTGGLAWPLVMGSSIACMVLAGHFQIAYYALVTLVAWLIALKGVTWRRLGFRATLGLEVQEKSGFVLGLLAGAIQLLPSAELVHYGHRIGAPPFASLAEGALGRYDLAALVAPNLLGNPSHGWYLTPLTQNRMEMCGYVGTMALVLAGAGLAACRRNWAARFFAALAVGALLVAAGTPLAHTLYVGLPGFNRFSGLPRVLCLFCLGAALLAGYGVDELRRAREGRDWALAGSVAVAVLGLLCLARVGPEAVATDRRAALPVAVGGLGLVLTLLLVRFGGTRRLGWMWVCLAGVELLGLGRGTNLTIEPSNIYAETALTNELRQLPVSQRVLALTDDWTFGRPPLTVLPPNSATVYGIRDVQGYDSLFAAHTKSYLMRANGGRQPCPAINGNMVLLGRNGPDPVAAIDPKLLRQMGVTRVLSRRPLPSGWGARHLGERGHGVSLYELPSGRDPGPMVTGLAANSVTLAGTMTGEGMWPTRESYYPGWYSVGPDGQQPCGMSDRMFRTVQPGATRAIYLPTTYWVGAFVSLVALAGLCALASWAYAGARQSRAGGDG